jgi:hypothetical protein
MCINPKTMKMKGSGFKRNREVTNPKRSRISLQSFRATLFLKFTIEMPPRPPPDLKSRIFPDFPGFSVGNRLFFNIINAPGQLGAALGSIKGHFVPDCCKFSEHFLACLLSILQDRPRNHLGPFSNISRISGNCDMSCKGGKGGRLGPHVE